MAEELGDPARACSTDVRRIATPARGAAAHAVGFVLEQTLGHITHANNLLHLVGADQSIDAVFAPVDFDVDGLGGPGARLRQLDGSRRAPRPAGHPPAAPAAVRSTRCSSTPRCRRS